jgi:gliding motility-associated-like protein
LLNTFLPFLIIFRLSAIKIKPKASIDRRNCPKKIQLVGLRLRFTTSIIACIYMKRKILSGLFFLVFFSHVLTKGQDRCETAFELTDVRNWCSDPGAFNNAASSPSSFPDPGCFSIGGGDQWYFFIAEATDVNVTVLGNVTFGNFGTLNQPEAVLYQGDCDGFLQEMECQTDQGGLGLLEIYQGGLVPGRRYYLRIRGRNNNRGSYQICLNNYFPPADLSSDCPTGTILCDKSSFYVESVTGPGEDAREMNDAPCLFFPGQNVETNSSWFQWTVAQTGTLVFTLSPANPIDDLDFVLYELPMGLGNCAQKRILRCMAAGAAPSEYPTPCHGPTGLNFEELDISEPPGCNQGQNNFLRFVILQEGRSYALAINNFTAAGNGFTIEFGGTATFKGPEFEIQTDAGSTLCSDELFHLQSFFEVGEIEADDILWTLGDGATLPNATGPGPFELGYTQGGLKTIIARAISKEGCVVIAEKQISIGDLPSYEPEWEAPSCPGTKDGFIELNKLQPPSVLSLWNNGQIESRLDGLGPGLYSVLLLTPEGCEKRDTFVLQAPLKMEFLVQSTLADCGENNGQLKLEILKANDPVLFDWNDGEGFVNQGEFSGLSAGFYPLRLRDSNGCLLDTILWVNEFDLKLDSINTLLTHPSCPGSKDGIIELFTQPGPLNFAVNSDSIFMEPGPLEDLEAGDYFFTVKDENNCLAFLRISLQDPLPPSFNASTLPPNCANSFDAFSEITLSGDRAPYELAWPDGSSRLSRSDLTSGTYQLTVKDKNQCEYLFDLNIPGPEALFIDELLVEDNICFGDSIGSIQFTPSGGSGRFTLFLEGKILSTNEPLSQLTAGVYSIVVEDSRGCRLEQRVTIDQGNPIRADAGQDASLTLGSSLLLEGSVFPPSGNYTYLWTPLENLNCPQCLSTLANPVKSGYFYFQVWDENLCSALDSIWVEINKNTEVFIPNVFSPNNDGINDFFSVFVNQGVEKVESMKIFNRWGALIYEGVDLPGGIEKLGWDGTFKGRIVDQGVYVYSILLRFKDNTVIEYSGDVTILR